MSCNNKRHPDQHPCDCDCTFAQCEKEIVQNSDISLPVNIYAGACAENIQTEFPGDPVVVCSQICSKACSITITQKVSVKIPVNYCVATCVGESVLECCPEDA